MSRSRISRVGRTAAVSLVGVLVVLAARPAGAAEVEIDNPTVVMVGDEVEVTVTVSDGGEAVVDGDVALAFLGRVAGESGWIVVAAGVTDENGVVTFDYRQGTLDAERMRVQYRGPDGQENFEFTMTVVDGPQQVRSDVGADLPIFGVWWIVVVLGAVWVLIIMATVWVGRIGRTSDLPAGPTRAIPRIMVAFVTFTALGMLIVVVTKPQSHANLDPAGDFDRVPRAEIGVDSDYLGLGLGSRDPSVVLDGQQLFVQSGCASCHGVQGGGAVVGGSIIGEDGVRSANRLIEEVREGPRGMPAFDEAELSDEDIKTIFAFLEAQSTD